MNTTRKLLIAAVLSTTAALGFAQTSARDAAAPQAAVTAPAKAKTRVHAKVKATATGAHKKHHKAPPVRASVMPAAPSGK